MIYMVHFGPLPPIWDLLDKRSDEALQLLSLEEFTDIVNGCAPNALLRNSFAILRIVSMARYLQHKTQEIYAVPKAWLSARVQSLPPPRDNAKRPRADAPRNPNTLKATLRKHCEGCGRPNHECDECRQSTSQAGTTKASGLTPRRTRPWTPRTQPWAK